MAGERSGSPSPLGIALGFLGGLVVAAGIGAFWLLSRTPAPNSPAPPAATLPTPAPPPTTEAAPPPPTEAAPPPATEPEAAPASAPPEPRRTKLASPAPSPPPPKPAVSVAGLLDEAAGAAADGRYEAAAALYEEVLKIEPRNAHALSGRAAASATAVSLRRAFVPGVTMAESVKAARSGLDGFDTSEVQVKKAPEVPGRIDLEAAPLRVKPGDRYAIKIYLRNDGKDGVEIKELNLARVVNGVRIPIASSVHPGVQPQQRVLVDEVTGVWEEGVQSWALDVLLTSDRGDVYRNRLTWR